MIRQIDRISDEVYEIYGDIGFRRYEWMSKREAIKRYNQEIKETWEEYYL